MIGRRESGTPRATRYAIYFETISRSLLSGSLSHHFIAVADKQEQRIPMPTNAVSVTFGQKPGRSDKQGAVFTPPTEIARGITGEYSGEAWAIVLLQNRTRASVLRHQWRIGVTKAPRTGVAAADQPAAAKSPR